MIRRSIFPLLIALLSITSWRGIPEVLPRDAGLSVLFVGNSLTYENDLPGLVRKAARKKGLRVLTDMIAYPDYALIDHWEDGLAQKKISEGGYDVVIMQQGPSSQPEGRNLLMRYGLKFVSVCETNGARPAFFMVWPARSQYQTFDGVIGSYRLVAETYGAMLLPVGEAWKSHFDATSQFDYYGPDGFHPSLEGSRAAANIIAECLARIKMRPE